MQGVRKVRGTNTKQALRHIAQELGAAREDEPGLKANLVSFTATRLALRIGVQRKRLAEHHSFGKRRIPYLAQQNLFVTIKPTCSMGRVADARGVALRIWRNAKQIWRGGLIGAEVEPPCQNQTAPAKASCLLDMSQRSADRQTHHSRRCLSTAFLLVLEASNRDQTASAS